MIKTLVATAISATFFVPVLGYSQSWSEPFKIDRVLAPPDGNTFFRMSASLGHQDCPEARYVRLTPSAEGFNRLYANMLLAKSMDYDVTFSSGSGVCLTPNVVADPYLAFE